MLPEWGTIKLSELALDLLLDVLVESIEFLDEVMKIKDLHYLRERELFAK